MKPNYWDWRGATLFAAGMIFVVILVCVQDCGAKVIEKSCPLCGQCEPHRLQGVAISIGEPVWVCDSTPLRFFWDKPSDAIKRILDTIKWVPKRVGVIGLPGGSCGVTTINESREAMKTVTLDTGKYPWYPHGTPKRKCVEEIVTQIRAGGITWNDLHGGVDTTTPLPWKADTSWCECDGDSVYWRMVPQLLSDSCEAYGCAIYVRREDRWRKETKTVWVKRKKTVKEVWE